MADTIDPARADNAPLASSKHPSAAVDAANERLVDAPNDGADTLIGHTVTINRPRNELFAYWRDFTRLPTFMENVEKVEMIDDTRSRWVVKAPGGKTVEWTSAITEEVDGKMIAWASEKDADVGQDDSKADPAKVAKDGWSAMKDGKGHIVSWVSNELQVAASGVVPQSILAEMHRGMAEPGSGKG